MTNQYENEQRDEQVASTSDDATGARIDAALKDLHTHAVGVIVSFDSVKQTCTVQPAIQRVWTSDGRPVSLPVCVDCPVEFPGGGDFVLTFPVKPGDECMISFSERCIDNWFVNGQLAAPAEYRMHDLSDGIVRVGLNNQTKSIPNFRTDGVDLRSRDGNTRITLHANGTIENVSAEGNTVLSADGKFTINAPGGFIVNSPHQTNTGDIVAQGDVAGQGTSLHNHTHNVPLVQAGTVTKPTTSPL